MILNDRRTFGSPAATHLNTGGACLSFHMQLRAPCTPPDSKHTLGAGKEAKPGPPCGPEFGEGVIGDVIRSSPLREARRLIKGKAKLTWAFP